MLMIMYVVIEPPLQIYAKGEIWTEKLIAANVN